MPTSKASAAASVLTVSPGPSFWPWPSPLYVCLHLTLATTQGPPIDTHSSVWVHITYSGHHCCQNWSLGAKTRATAEETNSLAATKDALQCLSSSHPVGDAVNLSGLSQWDITFPPGHRSATHSYIWHPAPVDLGSKHTAAFPHLWWRPFLTEVRYLYKATGIMKNLGNMNLLMEHNKLTITDSKEIEIHRLFNK